MRKEFVTGFLRFRHADCVHVEPWPKAVVFSLNEYRSSILVKYLKMFVISSEGVWCGYTACIPKTSRMILLADRSILAFSLSLASGVLWWSYVSFLNRAKFLCIEQCKTLLQSYHSIAFVVICEQTRYPTSAWLCRTQVISQIRYDMSNSFHDLADFHSPIDQHHIVDFFNCTDSSDLL